MVNKDYFTNLQNYMTSYLHAKKMNDMGIISKEDLKKVDKKLRQKYSIKSNSIYISFDWIITPFRGNM